LKFTIPIGGNVMDVMYPHAIDRLRVMSFLLRSWRYSLPHKTAEKVCICTQAKLATNAGFKNGDIISDLESLNNLARCALRGEPPVARETFIKVLNFGLRRSQKDIDAVLWLYEGESFMPLQENEVSDEKSPLKIAQSNQYRNGTELRSHIIDLITKALRVFIPNPKKDDAKVQMIFELDQVLGIESDQALLEIESNPGQRLTVTKYPSYLTYPPDIYDYGKWRASYEQLSDEGKQKRREVSDKRRRVFLQHLQVYGERSIHSKGSLSRYLQPECKHRLSYQQRIKQVKHWIKLLDTYDHYEIGLAEEEPELELAIKNTVGAFLSGPPGETYSQETPSKEQGIHCGPWYVKWCDEESIFAFLVDFERNWAAIPDEWRKKTTVINWLRERLPNSGGCRYSRSKT
jgi:hypothetical protein